MSGRSPHVIAAEINIIKYQAERIYPAATVKIGRWLTEANRTTYPLRFGFESELNYSQAVLFLDIPKEEPLMLPTATQITHQCAI